MLMTRWMFPRFFRDLTTFLHNRYICPVPKSHLNQPGPCHLWRSWGNIFLENCSISMLVKMDYLKHKSTLRNNNHRIAIKSRLKKSETLKQASSYKMLDIIRKMEIFQYKTFLSRNGNLSSHFLCRKIFTLISCVETEILQLIE